MVWQQSNMFSSTAQVLEAYLESSPISSSIGSADRTRWTPDSGMTPTSKMADSDTTKILAIDSKTSSPRTSIINASPSASPTSSHTEYSSPSQSPKKNNSPEIRRRRLPEGAELRVKNLALKKSNGATNTQPLENSLTTAPSDYGRSPPMTSPIGLPPAPPPKAAARLINRKPLQNSSVEKTESVIPIKIEENLVARNLDLSQHIMRVTSPKRSDLPPRTTSLNKSDKPLAAVGLRPKPNHKKNLSTASTNKDLPPEPQREHIAKLAISSENGNITSTTMTQVSSMQSTTAPRGLPAGPKAQANAAVERRPVPIVDYKQTMSTEDLRKEVAKPGPSLGSLSSGPKPKPKHQVSASLTSLTSATVSGPIPMPDFGMHRRAESDLTTTIKTHKREKSSPRVEDAIITIALDASQPAERHRPTPSQNSIRSESSMSSRSNTPYSQRSNSTAATSVSSLPNVPEVRTPLIAPEIDDSHLTCYTQHNRFVLSSNHQQPVLCMTCKQDAEKMFACGFCNLRICTGCRDALVEVRNDLRTMLDKASSGSLIIGKERIPNQPYAQNSGPRSIDGETSSIRSNESSGSRGMPRRAPGPIYGPPQGSYLRPKYSMDSLQSRGNPHAPYGPPPNRRGPLPQQQMRTQPPNQIGMPGQQYPMMPRQRQPGPQYPPSKPSSVPHSPSMPTPPFGPVTLGFPSRSSGASNDSMSGGYYSNQPSYPPNDYHIPPPRNNNPNGYPPPHHPSHQRQGSYATLPQARGPYGPSPQHHQGGYSNAPPQFRRPGGPPPPHLRQQPLQQQRFFDEDALPTALDLSLDAGAGPMAAGLRGLNLGGVARGVNAMPLNMREITGGGGGGYGVATGMARGRAMT